jgi:hypothetical protein
MAKMLQVPVYRGRTFVWEGCVGLADLSDLRGHGPIASRVYPDASDVGFLVEGRTGRKLFTLEREETTEEGDLHSLTFRSADGRFRVVLFND